MALDNHSAKMKSLCPTSAGVWPRFHAQRSNRPPSSIQSADEGQRPAAGSLESPANAETGMHVFGDDEAATFASGRDRHE